MLLIPTINVEEGHSFCLYGEFALIKPQIGSH